jgi:hypothetical protein
MGCYQHFSGVCACIIYPEDKAVHSSKASEPHTIMWCHNLEAYNLNFHFHEKVKPHKHTSSTTAKLGNYCKDSVQ